jgi:hypothetical protein
MIVIGADTHKRSHALAAVDEGTGRVRGQREIKADEPGHLAAVRWARGRSRAPRASANSTGSTEAATASSTMRCTSSRSAAPVMTRPPRPTSPARRPKGRPPRARCAASNARSPGASTTSSPSQPRLRGRITSPPRRSLSSHASANAAKSMAASSAPLRTRCSAQPSGPASRPAKPGPFSGPLRPSVTLTSTSPAVIRRDLALRAPEPRQATRSKPARRARRGHHDPTPQPKRRGSAR